jgi:hypothetical protein
MPAGGSDSSGEIFSAPLGEIRASIIRRDVRSVSNTGSAFAPTPKATEGLLCKDEVERKEPGSE